MKKRRTPREEHTPEDRKRKIHFKKKKQRFEENYFNPKRMGNLEDLDDLDEFD